MDVVQFYFTCCFNFVVSPKITDISADRTVNLGDIVPLKCTAAGFPLPRITWTKMSDSSVVTSPLTIASKQDEGIYRCTADNGVGTPDSRDVAITVTGKFVFQILYFLPHNHQSSTFNLQLPFALFRNSFY